MLSIAGVGLMDLHEYQAKQILKKFGVLTPDFVVISNLNEVQHAIDLMNLEQAVIKVQIHAGGRGKAGGVKLASNRQEIFKYAEKLLNMRIINEQTGKNGIVATKLIITPCVEFQKEYYVAAAIDRENAQSILILSPEGGMEIEEIAKTKPEKILKIPFTLNGKLRNYQYLRIAKFMGWDNPSLFDHGKEMLKAIAKAFVETDASLLEINPLVLTRDGKLLALDAKLSIDDNALYRQPDLREFYDPTQHSESESNAKKFDLAYVALDGDIGCMVNGAGLAMATMDIINYYGGTPANFLDVGGGASEGKVAEGFKIILSDSKVKAILINIFGGIMNCETLAKGIIAAAKELGVFVPLIVRMEGTHVEQGKKLLAESGLNIQISNTLMDAAQKVVLIGRE